MSFSFWIDFKWSIIFDLQNIYFQNKTNLCVLFLCKSNYHFLKESILERYKYMWTVIYYDGAMRINYGICHINKFYGSFTKCKNWYRPFWWNHSLSNKIGILLNVLLSWWQCHLLLLDWTKIIPTESWLHAPCMVCLRFSEWNEIVLWVVPIDLWINRSKIWSILF